MRVAAFALCVIVITLHFAFAAAEMFYWQHPAVMARFGASPEFAKSTAVLAANQGVYNAILAAATLSALLSWNRAMLLVLLTGIIVAGIYGGLTVKPTIMLVQSLPAALAFIAVWFAGARPQSR